MPTEHGGQHRAFYLRHSRILNLLFTVKNLKPATIAGYRIAIADHLGPFGQEVARSLHLNRLLASFYKDKPILNRDFPSWDLSLVLMSLTNAPFEPLKDASLKILTFKTFFLMALAAGKRKGEVHAWTFSSLRHKPHWKEITISPSPAFLAKNQLASVCPDSLKPVVIPALKPFLSSDLTEDMTLYPVRALRYYLDRTSALRKGKYLLFMSFKEALTEVSWDLLSLLGSDRLSYWLISHPILIHRTFRLRPMMLGLCLLL